MSANRVEQWAACSGHGGVVVAIVREKADLGSPCRTYRVKLIIQHASHSLWGFSVFREARVEGVLRASLRKIILGCDYGAAPRKAFVIGRIIPVAIKEAEGVGRYLLDSDACVPRPLPEQNRSQFKRAQRDKGYELGIADSDTRSIFGKAFLPCSPKLYGQTPSTSLGISDLVHSAGESQQTPAAATVSTRRITRRCRPRTETFYMAGVHHPRYCSSTSPRVITMSHETTKNPSLDTGGM
ncbi:hypothetical protein B0H13DRAFT_1917228 [Mycena leptocephala]|nr:hypothetical protein B0H13DRAFT_1917228 [Mycena leptocephala]